MPTRDLLFLLLINGVWGLALVAAAASLKHFPPLEFTWFRFMLVSIVLVPFLKWHEGQMKRIFWIAMTGGTFNFALLFLGMHLAGKVSTVAIAGQLGVPFATIMSIVFLGEVVRWRRWTGIALAFVGVVIIGFDPQVMDHLDGFLAVVGCAAVGSVSSILMRQMKNVPVFQMQAWIATLSWPVLMVMSLIFESGSGRRCRLRRWNTGAELHTPRCCRTSSRTRASTTCCSGTRCRRSRPIRCCRRSLRLYSASRC